MYRQSAGRFNRGNAVQSVRNGEWVACQDKKNRQTNGLKGNLMPPDLAGNTVEGVLKSPHNSGNAG
jgi:hypothetical protein